MRGAASSRLGLVVVAALAGCGTYSFVRPADTLPEGKVDLAAGLAVSQVEANTILHAAVGVTDDVEILAQNEVWNSFVEARYGFLHSDENGLGLTVGAGAGYAVTLISALTSSSDDEYDSVDGSAATVSLALGKRWPSASVTLGHRTFWLTAGYLASSTRLSLRWYIGERAGLLLEAGATAHMVVEDLSGAFVIGEGAFGGFVGF
jgi:hypothetical protein